MGISFPNLTLYPLVCCDFWNTELMSVYRTKQLYELRASEGELLFAFFWFWLIAVRSKDNCVHIKQNVR
jgi:hypothetical protein